MRQAAIQDPLIERFAAEMRRRLGDRLKEVILYGSRARGDAEPDSDYDFLAVLDRVSLDARLVLAQIAASFLYEQNVVFSIVPVSSSRLQTEDLTPFLRNVRAEGVVL